MTKVVGRIITQTNRPAAQMCPSFLRKSALCVRISRRPPSAYPKSDSRCQLQRSRCQNHIICRRFLARTVCLENIYSAANSTLALPMHHSAAKLRFFIAIGMQMISCHRRLPIIGRRCVAPLMAILSAIGNQSLYTGH